MRNAHLRSGVRLLILTYTIASIGCSTVDDAGGLDVPNGVDAPDASGMDEPTDASDTTDPIPCQSNADCQDENPCTQGVCGVSGICEVVVSEGISCDDGDLCTSGETCQPKGECGGGEVIELNASSCETCICDPIEGITCEPYPIGSPCDDRDCCSVGGTCQACDPETDPSCPEVALTCLSQPVDCDDDNPCTIDSCVCETETPQCLNDAAPNGTACDYSSNDCTIGDSCLGGQCILSPPIDLDDQNPCTEDLCEKGEVVHTPLLTGQCDDGDECTTDDYCLQGACVGGDAVTCASGPCDSSASCVSGQGCVVVPKPAGASCDSDNPCAETSACDDAGQCQPLASINCDDLNPCTSDICDPAIGCVITADEALEGVACEGPDATCTVYACAAGLCAVSGAMDCDDEDPCTVDSCEEDTGCVHTPIDDCDIVESCVRYGFEWIDAYDISQSGTFDVVGQSITAVTFDYALYQPGACDDLTSPWCHFPGAAWAIQDSSFTAFAPESFFMHATSEHDTELYFYKQDHPTTPAIYLYKPYGSQYTVAEDPEVIWSTVGPCNAETDPCDGVVCDDDDACTIESCVNGECILQSTLSCDDLDPCTEDSCDAANGCTHDPISGCGDAIGCASQAAEFDGQTCIEVGGIDALTATTYTVEFWLQALDATGAQMIIDKREGEGGFETPGWSIEYNNMGSPFAENLHYQEMNNTGNQTGVVSMEPFSVGVWRHYAITRQQSGLMNRFVDGEPMGSGQNNQVVADQTTSGPMYIGCRDLTSGWFTGRIDALRISDGVRYSAAFEPPTDAMAVDDTTLLLYHFDEPNDGIALDSGPLGLHGTWVGQDLRPAVSPVLSCDDLDPCTTDQCVDGSCVHTPIDGCGEEPELCGEETVVNCTQQGEGCCCFKDTHTLDLGQVIVPGQAIECCVRPGLNCGCQGTASLSVSADGESYTELSAFTTVSEKVDGSCPSPNQAVGWKDYCEVITSDSPFQFVEGQVTSCYNDFFQCTIPASSCDDEDPCTLDQCDPDSGSCTHTPLDEEPTCLGLSAGNNLVSFYALPEVATLENTFGEDAETVKWFYAEGVAGYRLLDGTLVGNYRVIEPWRGYWMNMTDDVILHLSGTPRPVDLMYQLHEGINMVSFSGSVSTGIPEGIAEYYEPEFIQLVGAGVIATKSDTGQWIGNAQLDPWRGYEVKVTQDIDDFVWDLEVSTPSTTTYGCTHPMATNFDPLADVEDGNCLFDVPSDWTQPKWVEGDAMHQLIVIIHASSLGDAPTGSTDVIGAFHNDLSVGFGFLDDEFVTLAAMNVPHDGLVSFRRYDAGTGDIQALDWTVSAPTLSEGYKTRFIIVGCTDPAASNYLPDATVEGGGCTF